MQQLRTEVELANLFAEYFGEKLEPSKLERLVADVAAALVDRQAAAGLWSTDSDWPRDDSRGSHSASAIVAAS